MPTGQTRLRIATSSGRMKTMPKGLDHLVGRIERRILTTTDRLMQRVWQVVKAGQGYRAIGREFLGEDNLSPDDAPAGDGPAPMSGVEQPANVLVVLGPWSKDGVDLVVEDGRRSGFVSHLAEQIRRGGVHCMDGTRHQQLRYLKRPRFPASGFR